MHSAKDIQSNPTCIEPNWPAPANIKAFTTLRKPGGNSNPPYDSFNLGMGGDDDHDTVQTNRKLLMDTFDLPAEPLWIKQIHGIDVAEYLAHGNKIRINNTLAIYMQIRHQTMMNTGEPIIADASIAFSPNQVCAVLTADCLPLLICDKKGTKVAAIHAGWRGLAAGVIEATVKKLIKDPKDLKDLLVWLGPAIGPNAFEVGEDVLTAFNVNPANLNNNDFNSGFKKNANGRFLADIYFLARQRLQHLGIDAQNIFAGDHCTFTEKDKFFSFRRDQETGRMASLIWISKA